MATTATEADPRVAAFCSAAAPDAFHAVAHRHEIAHNDPDDVATIHAEARDAFRQLLGRASGDPPPASGRILLLLGDAGCGKTHLMRAFRGAAHGAGLGYFGYMQMTTATPHYARYIVNNLIDSLEQPYDEARGATSGLVRLSTAMAESARDPERLARLRQGELDAEGLAASVEELADLVVLDERVDALDLDLVRALLYLQRDDARVRARVLKYLRCEPLAAGDRRALGGLFPRIYNDAPQVLVEKLGALMRAVGSAALVLGVDQLEDIHHHEDARSRFRRAMAALCDVADRVPSSVVVVACLADLYAALRGDLTGPIVDRLEHDPAPITLKAGREAAEVGAIVGRRLRRVFAAAGVDGADDGSIFPFPADFPTAVAGQRPRDVLLRCREFRERCARAGRIVAWEPGATAGDEPTGEPIRLEQAWNDFRSGFAAEVPAEDEPLAKLLAWAIAACSDEVGDGSRFTAKVAGDLVEVSGRRPDGSGIRLLVGLCNRSARGGGLGKQVARLREEAAHRGADVTPLVARSTDFPSSPNAQVVQQLAALVAGGGRRAVVEDAAWRTMLALREFRGKHASDPDLESWLRRERPLAQLHPLRTMLELDREAAGAAERRG